MNTLHISKAIRFLCTLAMLAMAAAPPIQAAEDEYVQHNLASDGFVPADNNDPNLVNGGSRSIRSVQLVAAKAPVPRSVRRHGKPHRWW